MRICLPSEAQTSKVSSYRRFLGPCRSPSTSKICSWFFNWASRADFPICINRRYSSTHIPECQPEYKGMWKAACGRNSKWLTKRRHSIYLQPMPVTRPIGIPIRSSRLGSPFTTNYHNHSRTTWPWKIAPSSIVVNSSHASTPVKYTYVFLALSSMRSIDMRRRWQKSAIAQLSLAPSLSNDWYSMPADTACLINQESPMYTFLAAAHLCSNSFVIASLISLSGVAAWGAHHGLRNPLTVFPASHHCSPSILAEQRCRKRKERRQRHKQIPASVKVQSYFLIELRREIDRQLQLHKRQAPTSFVPLSVPTVET